MTTMFARETTRHELAARRVSVVAINDLAPAMRRITVTGSDLDGFVATGPADHVRLCFPDPATGELHMPEFDPVGLRRPTEGVLITRDYTPLRFRPMGDSGGPELDLDFVLHGDEGPASAWAAAAVVGAELGVVGPRGSRGFPAGVHHLVLVIDETALPAAARWLALSPTDARTTVIAEVADEGLESYFADTIDPSIAARASIEWLYRVDNAPGQLEESLRSVTIDDGTFVFLAGESGALAPLRRYLKHELGLPREQYAASGYWRRGVVNLDHHAPIDASDPD